MNDTYELPISTGAGGAYNRALKAFTGYDADVVERVQALQQADPHFALGHCLGGYVMMLSYSQAAVPVAAEAVRAAEQHAPGATAREQSHVRALGRWVAGDVDGAMREWEAILAVWPRDALALRLLHANYFWRGQQSPMRASLERVAAHWTNDSGFLACLAFALEETGDFAAAERMGRRAVELDPTEVWGAHAVAHVLEMQRRPEEGIAWLNSLEPHWIGKGAFLHHLWWHRAMYHVARREFDAALELYDQRFRNLASPLVMAMPDFYVDVQNAASMLLRLELRGVQVGGRWEELADKAQARVGDCVSVFTLPHWMMALAAGGRDAPARAMLDVLKEHASPVVREVALPVCQAVLAHRRREHDEAVLLMSPLLGRLQELGGSHAQRDVFTQLFDDSSRWVQRVAA
jgi:tetratricopeptide (TPR) repeat protein